MTTTEAQTTLAPLGVERVAAGAMLGAEQIWLVTHKGTRYAYWGMALADLVAELQQSNDWWD
jgi:hypothetical protein